MLKNYFVIAIRNLFRQKGYFIINLLGLSIGMTAVIFILLWVQDEKSYDQFHENADQIYRITQRSEYDGKVLHSTQTPGILAPTLIDVCPEVESVTRVRGFNNATLIKTTKKTLNETKHGMADEFFFKVFSFELISGNPETVLKSPFTVVISESAAKKYFEGEQAIGQILNIYDDDYQITGVYKDMPSNSHFHLDIIFSIASFPRYDEAKWGINAFKTYALLRKEADANVLQTKLNDIIKNYMFSSVEDYNRTIDKGNSKTMPIQKLTDIHLTSHLLWEFESNGNNNYVKYLSFIALLILIIALVNYINLSTALSSVRAKEVGIKKTIGSSRISLVWQFLSESVLTSFLAFMLTIALIIILMPIFKNIVGKPWLDLDVFNSSWFLIMIIVCIFLTGLLAGIYPSMVLSSFKPISVLRGKFSSGVKSSGLRNGLVVFQFAMSIILLIASLVIHLQIKYSQTKNLGFDRQRVVVLKTYGEAGSKIDILRKELKKNPNVVNASISTSLPGKSFNNIGINLEGTSSWIGTNMCAVDYDFLDVMQMEMVNGRFFSRNIPTDIESVIINESKAKEIGLSNIENRRFIIWTGSNQGDLPFKLIGIIKDFHYESFYEKVKPMAMIMTPGAAGWTDSYLSIKINSENIPETLNYIEEIWSKVIPEVPFEYSFMNSIYDDLYKNEVRIGKIFTIFTFFALIVACMGLIGLTSFVVEQKKKEIGIRKVLGATINGLVVKISSEFTKWVLVANVIAWPLAYIWMKNWLDNFAYRVELELWMFFAAGIIAFFISGLTVSLQAIRAARVNPFESLKCE